MSEDSSIPQMEAALAVAGDTVQERPSWLPEDWKFKSVVRMGGATAGLTDHYYYEPLSGKRFRSKIAVLDFLSKKGTPKGKNKEVVFLRWKTTMGCCLFKCIKA